MANQCDNYLYVFSDNEEQLDQFMEDVKGIDDEEEEILSVEKLIPSPEEHDFDWYDENWGAGCVYNSELLYASNSMLHYFFISHWTPPIQWVRNVARLYPDLCFFMKYKEDGIGLFGGCIAKNERFANLEIDDITLLSVFNPVFNIDFAFSEDEIEIFMDNIAESEKS